jgi:lipopolysaccharide transport system permease protein
MILFLPIYLIIITTIIGLISIILAYLTPFVADIRYLINLVLPLMLWITPITYPIETMSEKMQIFQKFLNPIYILINPMTNIVCFNKLPNLYSHLSLFGLLIISYIVYRIVYKYLDKKVIYYV